MTKRILSILLAVLFAVSTMAVAAPTASATSGDILIAFTPPEGGTVTCDKGFYTSSATSAHIKDAVGTQMVLTAAPNEGYGFAGWYERYESTSPSLYAEDNPLNISVGDSLLLLYAVFKKEYSVSVISDPSNAGSVRGAGTYLEGDDVKLIVNPSSKYAFDGWYENGALINKNYNYEIQNISSNHTVTAKFRREFCSVSATVQNAEGGTVTGEGTYPVGANATLTAKPVEGYVFDGWYTRTGGEESLFDDVNPLVLTGLSDDVSLTAKFKKLCTVTVTADPAEGGTVSGGGTYVSDTEVFLNAEPNEGYVFDGWYRLNDEGGESCVELETSYFFEPTGDCSMIARFQKKTCTVSVTADPSEGGTVSGGGTYTYGSDVTVAAEPNAGYVFEGWFKLYDGERWFCSESASYTIYGLDDDYTLIAKFKKETYTVTVAADPAEGGTVSGGGTFNQGTITTLTAVPNGVYTFAGWYDGDTKLSDEASFSYSVTKTVTLTAHFTKPQYTVTATADPAEGGTVSGGGAYEYGETATLTAVPNEGYYFSCWLDGQIRVSDNASYTCTVTRSRSLTAKFYKKLYSVSASASPQEGGRVTGGGATYYYGDTAALHAYPSAGYVFAGWYDGDTLIDSSADLNYTVTKEVNLIAKFEKGTYTVRVTADPPEGGTVTGGGTYAYDAAAELTAVPNEGYTFDGWYCDGNLVAAATENPLSIQLDETYNYMELTAVFVKKSYTIVAAASPAEGGTVTGGGTYAYGEVAELTAVPNEGYRFDGWYSEGNLVAAATENPLRTWLDETYNYMELTAVFVKKGYTIAAAASPAEGGTVTGGGSYNEGDEVTLTAVPNQGYYFSCWMEGGMRLSDSASYSFTATRSCSLTAVFYKNYYALSVTESPFEGGTASGGGSYLYGDSATLTAVPNAGYSFDGWYDGDTKISGELTFSYTVTGKTDLTAKFVQKKYTIVVAASPAKGGTVSGGGVFTYDEETVLTAVPNAGYAFAGWYNGDSFFTDKNPVALSLKEPNDYAELTAMFIKQTYTVSVTAAPADGGTVSGGGAFEYGDITSLTAAANRGYSFAGWFDGETQVSGEPTFRYTVTASGSLTAKFTKNTYTVSAAASPAEGGTAVGSGSYEFGASATLTAAANEGYTFDGWYSGDTKLSGEAAYSFRVEQDVSLTAKFTKNTYTVAALASPASGGSASVVGGSFFEHGASAAVIAEANDGYTFDGWYENGVKVSGEDVYTFTVTKPAVLTAKFTKITYTVSVNASPAEGGAASGEGVFDQGANATVTAVTNNGYHFLGWYEGSAKVADSTSYTFAVTKNVILTAKFEKDVPPARISIRNYTANTTIDYRATITFTAVVENPVAGAAVRWFVDGQDVGTGETYTVSEAKKNFNVQVKYVKDGEILSESEVETVKVNSGFFAKLKAFFRALFGKLPVVVQEYLGGELIDRILAA